MHKNLILNTDSYKVSHWKQYPPGTEYVYSYIESRGGKFDRTLFFGLQMFLKEYLSKPITQEDIDEAENLWMWHGEPFNREGWQHILKQHGGFLPIEIRAVDEGTVVPVRNILLSVVNTDPKVPWITSYIETALLRAIWYPTTVATESWFCKKHIRNAYLKSADTLNNVSFSLVDFGARGVSSEESSAIGGAAHLVNFQSTDNMSGILAAKRYYGARMPGFSIPAAEHSTITSWGREGEKDAYANMLKQFNGPNKMVAVVSDSYDIYNAVDYIWGDQLRREVINGGGTVIIRPDSGNPLTMPISVVSKLSEKFGYTVNSKGYKVLPSYLRVIQGDGIDVNSLPVILDNLLSVGFSAENLSFGMGGGLLQHVNRDTQKFAMKASAAYVNGQWRDVFKDPITDPGKVSKKGQLALVRVAGSGDFATVSHDGHAMTDMLYQVYRNGDIQREQDFEDIRNLANNYMA